MERNVKEGDDKEMETENIKRRRKSRRNGTAGTSKLRQKFHLNSQIHGNNHIK